MAVVERHGEIVRQWRILLALEGRARGLTLAQAAQVAGDGVSERTIRRDFDALAQAGFPIEVGKRDGKAVWTLNRDAFHGIAAAGFSLSELCALYLSRTLLSSLAGAPFQNSLASAFDKLYEALPAALWSFIDRLPDALGAKQTAARSSQGAAARTMEALMAAILARRRVRMQYHSFSSRATKTYVIEPYRLAYAQGSLYLQAFVPEYGEMRTFAAQRIQQAATLDESFSPVADSPGSIFPHALGAFSGAPTRVVLDFDAEEAPYIREREWHPSQRLRDLPHGGLELALDVAIDFSLRSWILGFGAAVVVREPADLAADIAARLEKAHARYRAAGVP